MSTCISRNPTLHTDEIKGQVSVTIQLGVVLLPLTFWPNVIPGRSITNHSVIHVRSLNGIFLKFSTDHK